MVYLKIFLELFFSSQILTGVNSKFNHENEFTGWPKRVTSGSIPKPGPLGT